MSTWHFYDPATGLFSGASFAGEQADMQAQLDAKGVGTGAYLGEVDYLSQRLAGLDLDLVDYQPPAPPDTVSIIWSWNALTKRWVDEPTQATLQNATRAAYESEGQALLDRTARSWGYDSMLSAASYIASTVPKFKAEAQALTEWRDALWSAAYGIEAQVSQGNRPLPGTAEEFIALLPAPPARPVDASK